MHSTRIAAVLAALPLLAAADAADPAAPVPPPTYRSALPEPVPGIAEPDIPWRDANAAVARFPRGHADVLKWEERQATPAASAPAPVPPPGRQER